MKDVKTCAIIRNSKGEFLLQLRNIEPEKGTWVFFGGAVEENETEEQGCTREIKEELEYEIKGLKRFGSYKDKKCDQTVFIIKETVELSQCKLNEGDAMKFFSKHELNNLNIGFNCKEILLDVIKKEN